MKKSGGTLCISIPYTKFWGTIPITPAIYAHVHNSRQKVWPWLFTHQGHPRSNLTVSIESHGWLLSKKSSLGSNLIPVTLFKIFRINGLWPWPLTSQGHPKWSPWAFCVISVGFSIVIVGVFDIFHVKMYDLDFWPLIVIQGQMWQCQSKARGSYV